jgi:phosphonoacetate hydrolase
MGPAYVEAAIERGLWPRVREWTQRGGSFAVAQGVLPSFTNPNNLSLVTGLSPAAHGICGNHYFDAALRSEVASEDPACLRAETILARLEREGARVASVTSKDKLRRLLGAGRAGPSFSAERAHEQSFADWGIDRFDTFTGEPVPPIYSPEASTFVLRAGLRLLVRARPDLLYLSTTDYLQHRFAPGAPELDTFLREIDRCLGELADAGARVAVTADHGMNDKPRIVWLGEILPNARVVLPITDPYVRHHGALGACAFVSGSDPEHIVAALREAPGVVEALPRDEAADRYALPADRIGDVVVFGGADTVFGKTPAEHDLSALEGPLRSHGGPGEQVVPILLSDGASAPNESYRLLEMLLAEERA